MTGSATVTVLFFAAARDAVQCDSTSITSPGPFDGNRLLDPGELGDFIETEGGDLSAVDPNIKHPYGDEFSVHFEHELMPSLSVRSSYVYKNIRKLDSEVDVGQLPEYTIPWTYHDIGADQIEGTADDQMIDLVDRPKGVPSEVLITNPGPHVGTPWNNGDYHTFEIALNRRLKDRWLLLTSFGHTWIEDWIDPSPSTTSSRGRSTTGCSGTLPREKAKRRTRSTMISPT